MSLKKRMLAIVSIMIFTTILLLQTVGYTATANPSITFGITKIRDRGGIKLGYGIGDPLTEGAYIWNIKKYNSTEDSGNGTNVPAYCLKADQQGTGFTQGDKGKATFDRVFNMATERNAISSQNTVLKGLVDGKYNEILAVLDLFYIPESSTAAEDKTTLLENAGIPADSSELTDNDIEAIQQAALWYFTNTGEDKFNKYSNTHWITICEATGSQYDQMSNNYDNNRKNRNDDMENLYKYLIDTATANASKYATEAQSTQPITINKDSAQITEDGNYYKVGPFTVTKNNDLPVTLTATVQNGSSNIEYTIVNGSGEEKTLDQMKQTAGQYYVKVLKTAVTSTINIEFKTTATTTGKNLYAVSTDNNEQPIVLLDKTPNEERVNVSLTPEKPKIRDLALRKYITELNETELTSDTQGPRNPNITNTDVLKGEDAGNHTATYNHRKDPVSVENENTVTYTIEVFNEGNVAGKATEITDQLPTGLEYEEGSITGDYTVKEYKKETNTLILQTQANNLAAYDSGTPKSHKAVIKCKVTAEAGENDKVLTNLAWISQDTFAEAGKDIDSDAEQPERHPTAEELVSSNKDTYKGNDNNDGVSSRNDYWWKGQQDDDDFEKVIIPGTTPKKVADLALRKYISQVNDKAVGQGPRKPSVINTDVLNGEDPENHTATYNHRKDPVKVTTDTIVTYTIEVYNEGQVKGKATEVTDQLPIGLEYIEDSVSGDYTFKSYDKQTNTLVLQLQEEATDLNEYSGMGNPESHTATVKCKVTATIGTENQVLTNLAWISQDSFVDESVSDIDSTATTPSVHPSAQELVNSDENNYKGHTDNENVSALNNYWKGQQDDDDFEKVVIEKEEENPADLRLIKRITKVNDTEVPERIESVDVTNLNNPDGTPTDTKDRVDAKIEMNKDPVKVKTGDFVTYTFRIYNEGYVDAYADEITEDIPDGLEFVYDEQGREGDELENATDLTAEEKEAIKFNQDMLWGIDPENPKQIKTEYLSSEISPESNLIPAFGANDGSKTEEDLHYLEVSVIFKVTSTDATTEPIRNEAEISKSTDEEGNELKDRDSDTKEWVKYEDDEDYDNVILETEEFDLALRKFIIAVSHDETIEDNEYLVEADGKTYSRAPIVDTSNLNETDENGKKVTTATYNHPKTPVNVTAGDTVVYMLRVYNEGDIDGYAAEIKDHLPNYLEFVDSEFNDEYGWEVSEDGKTLTTTYLKVTENENNEKVLDYEEVPVMCRVKLDAQTDYKITNIADITVYEDGEHNPAIDRDSSEDNVDSEEGNKPEYKDDETGEYIPGQEDDDDFEKVVVRIFDLSLRKWVSQAIVIEDGKTHTTDTGHTPYDDPEQIVKVDLNRKKLNTTVVKFRYGIRITNDGGIAGYAKEITDHIPAGLTMIESENPGWTNIGNNTVTTNLLADKLLQPGEYADIEILLTWENNENNLGAKINVAEISEDYNEEGIPDIDSIPGNQKEGEDDIDDAPVILSITTGKAITYFILTITVAGMLAGGITLIKKYVIK